jgi:signal transduction histidine kinase
MESARTISWLATTFGRLIECATAAEVVRVLETSLRDLEGSSERPATNAALAGAGAEDASRVLEQGLLARLAAEAASSPGMPGRLRPAIDCAVHCAETRLRVMVADEAHARHLALAAHDLRAPLAPILSSIQILRKHGVTGEEVDRIERQAKRLATIAATVLDAQRSGSMLGWSPVELSAPAESAIETTSPVFADVGVRFGWSVVSGLSVLGVHEGLVRVFSNLLLNAAKFTPRGGSVRLDITVSGHTARAEVKDDGLGIDPARLPTLFDPLRAGGLAAPQGHGLGLGIVREIVEQHGGTVRARSEGTRRGASFVVLLPLARSPLRRRLVVGPGAREIAEHLADPATVLHVCSSVRAAAPMLHAVRWQDAVVASSSTEAVQELKHLAPHLPIDLYPETPPPSPGERRAET